MAKPILLSVLAATIFWSTAILLAQEQLSAPVHKEGDTWQFNISKKGQRTRLERLKLKERTNYPSRKEP